MIFAQQCSKFAAQSSYLSRPVKSLKAFVSLLVPDIIQPLSSGISQVLPTKKNSEINSTDISNLCKIELTQHELHLDLGLPLHEGLDLGLEDVDALLHALGLLLDPGVDVAQLEIASLVETEGEFNDLVGIGEVGVCEVREVLVILR